MFVKQLSVFLENQRGSLCDLTVLLGKANVNIFAMSIADTEHFGIVRLILHSDQTEETLSLLKNSGYTAQINNVLCVKVPDRPAGLAEILTAIQDANLSIEYLYSFIRGQEGHALLIFRLDDREKGLALFEEKGIQLMHQAEVDAL